MGNCHIENLDPEDIEYRQDLSLDSDNEVSGLLDPVPAEKNARLEFFMNNFSLTDEETKNLEKSGKKRRKSNTEPDPELLKDDMSFLRETEGKEWDNYYCREYYVYTHYVTRAFKLWYYARWDENGNEVTNTSRGYLLLTERSLYFRIKNLFYAISLFNRSYCTGVSEYRTREAINDVADELMERVSRHCRDNHKGNRERYLKYNWYFYANLMYKREMNAHYKDTQKRAGEVSMEEYFTYLFGDESQKEVEVPQSLYISPEWSCNMLSEMEDITNTLNKIEIPIKVKDNALFDVVIRRLILLAAKSHSTDMGMNYLKGVFKNIRHRMMISANAAKISMKFKELEGGYSW